MYERICSKCDTEFTSSGANRICDKCRRSHNGYDKCECGNKKDKRAKRCRGCPLGAKERKVQGSNAGKIGAASRWWNEIPKEEKISDSNGYILVLASEHPKAHGGRIREHIIIMEKIIGRYLLPGETVHHKNGIKDDNRPSNLELWSKPQPTGARVSDQVAWARELLKQYGDLFPG